MYVIILKELYGDFLEFKKALNTIVDILTKFQNKLYFNLNYSNIKFCFTIEEII